MVEKIDKHGLHVQMTSLKKFYQTSFQGAQACSSSKLRKLEIKCSAMAVYLLVENFDLTPAGQFLTPD